MQVEQKIFENANQEADSTQSLLFSEIRAPILRLRQDRNCPVKEKGMGGIFPITTNPPSFTYAFMPYKNRAEEVMTQNC